MKLILATLLLCVCPAAAGVINIGMIAFDQMIPAGLTPGLNAISIALFADTFFLPPDFPVTSPVLLQAVSIQLSFDGGATSTVSLGDLGPGVYTPSDLQFSDTTIFTSATLTASLAPATVTIDAGQVLLVTNASVIGSLLPSASPFLSAGVDFAVLTVEVVDSAAIPEPMTWSLCVLAGLLGIRPAFARTRHR